MIENDPQDFYRNTEFRKGYFFINLPINTIWQMAKKMFKLIKRKARGYL